MKLTWAYIHDQAMQGLTINDAEPCVWCLGACNQMGPLIDQKLEDIDRYEL
jgi:hypothetical protein